VRVTTAVIGVPAFLGVLWLGGPVYYVLVMCIVLGAALEYFTITGFRAADREDYAFAVVLSLACAVLTTAVFPPKFTGPVLIGAMLAIMLRHMIRFGDMKTSVMRSGVMFLGVGYAGLLPTFFWHLRARPEGFGWVVMLLAVVWLSDTGAYFSGKALGRHKMYPAVSPGKSWEGAVGGLLSGIAGAFLAKWLFLSCVTPLECVLIAVPAGILGQAGDLCESLIKRAYGVKDSGSSIPGHGGVLDRFDAIFFAAPYIYFIARIMH
jgi:phosphatidate cytidylyltransferase